MKDTELFREVDRRHTLQLFDLICDSEYDPFLMIEGYSRLPSRIKADEGVEYYILFQPVNSYNDILRYGNVPAKNMDPDSIILHWMADIYLYALYEKGISFEDSVKLVSPRWLYEHYTPLHETSLANGWEKAWKKSIGEFVNIK